MELTPQTLIALAGLIREDSGISLGPDKSYLLRHRLAPVVRNHQLAGFDQLVDRMRLRTGSALRQAVIDAITVKETRFFRDHGCFEAIAQHVLPALFGANRSRRRLRIWSAAASTGQEAYSLAILASEFSEAHPSTMKGAVPCTILGSDVSDEAIQRAKLGRYSDAEAHRGLSAERLRRFFHRQGEGPWSARETLRQLVQFRQFNLMKSPEMLGPFDLILCRNVLIYFDDATRRKVCRGLHTALSDGGWLVLGSAESLYGIDHRFETIVSGRSILYRRAQRDG